MDVLAPECSRTLTARFGSVDWVEARGFEEYFWRAFIMSATFAGFAGALWAHHQSYVSPELLHWSLSGQFLIMTWLGGVGTLIGPLIGGAVLMTMADFLSSLMKNWLIFFGVLYIIVVLWAPNGLWGIVTRVGRSPDK